MTTYIVTGIVQMRINGAWTEQAIRISIVAPSGADAWKVALTCCAADLPDPYALVRWHSPELVRVEVA